MSERVDEDDRQHGPAMLTLAASIGENTSLRVTLPHVYEDGTAVPFVLHVGSPGLSLHAERAELERLHALIGRALEQDAARNEDGS